MEKKKPIFRHAGGGMGLDRVQQPKDEPTDEEYPEDIQNKMEAIDLINRLEELDNERDQIMQRLTDMGILE
jgi:hypothetical protein